MSITSVQKTSLLAIILVIIGGGAFVYFDPLDLDLLGLKQKPAVAHPAVPTHAAAPAAQPPATALKAPVAPTQAKAAVAVPSPKPLPAPAATSPATAPKAAVAPTQAKAPAAATPSPTSAPVAVAPAVTPPEAAAAQAPQPPLKLSKVIETASKPAIDKPTKPKNLDLRHCLDLETNAAIAKCAGE